MKLMIWFVIFVLFAFYVKASYYSSDLSNNLRGYWKFDEGTGNVTDDMSSNDNNGTLYGGASWILGRYSNAIHFDGINDYVNVTDNGDLGNGISTFPNGITMSVWIFPLWNVVGTSERSIFSKYYAMYEFNIAAGNQTRWRATYDKTLSIQSSVPKITNGWQQVVVTYDGSIIRYYHNGINYDTDARTGIINVTPVSNMLIIGSRGSGVVSFNGSMEEIRIYNTSLSSSQIKELYSCQTPNSGTGTWQVLGNCTVSQENDVFNQTLVVNSGMYRADNTVLQVAKAVASGGKIIATNGGKIIAA